MGLISIQQAFDLALQHDQAGRLQEAEQLYRQILARQPNHAQALHLLGVLAGRAGQKDVAVELIRRAIAFRPDYAEAHYNLGNALKDKGQLDEAIAAFRQAIALNPNLPEAHINVGNAWKDKGQLDEAIAAYRQAIALRPNYAEAHNNLGNALRIKGQLDESIAAYRQAIALRPNYPEAHINLGNAWNYKGQLDEAIAAYRQAIALRPNFAEALSNLGNVLKDNGQADEAVAAFLQAIALNPNLPEPHYNLSLSLLALGDFHQGWEEHEWRWKCKEFPSAARNFAQPRWDGCPLEGRSLLLHTEQGLGDAVQFIRYLPLAAQRGARIIIECQAELQRLFQTMSGNYQTVVRGQPLPAFDLHCPLLSLPWVFGTNLASIPNDVPYLHADAEDAGRWQDRLGGHCALLKVGLAWAGKPTHQNDRNRSMKLARLAPLGQLPGVHFFSLQKGTAAAEAKAPPAGMELVDWTEELKDFADTAALIANLDLVIAVDTAVVHLAGAMGKPVWTLLPFASDWRWLLDRADSPWYPTMRLFRQATPGDWDGVIRRVAAELSRHKSNRG
ncbi:MAG: tetratricopeptide repeat protein [Tepidisphaeraceae bacterium]|jgi:tetratricopeptide (TPR) repeat protein